MATDKQKEEARSRKPRHRRNLQMEELPTFTKWLTPFSHSGSCSDANSKSQRLNGYRSVIKKPIVVLKSSEEGGAVARDASEEDSVQAVADSISARAGCCCWQTSKSTRRECGFKFHLSLRRRKVVANGSGEEVAAAVSNLQEEEAVVVAVGDVVDKDGCGCSCLPTFHICGERKRTAIVGTSDVQKEEGAVTDGPNLRTEEVATSGTDLVKEEEVIVGQDLRKEERSGYCCGRWECLPAFHICRRRKVVAAKEEVIVHVPKVEEAAVKNVVNTQDDDSGTLEDDNPETLEKKEAVASNDSSNVGDPDLQKEGTGCCSCFKCVPICGRRRNVDSDVPNPGKEEKVDQPEERVVAADKERHSKSAQGGIGWPSQICTRGCVPICGRRRNVDSDVPNTGKEEKLDQPEERVVAPDKERHSKSAQGGIGWPFQNCTRGWFPRFFLCREKTVIDTSNHREEEEKIPPDVHKEDVVVAIPDPHKENIAVADDIPDHSKEKHVVADDIPVLSKEEKVSAGDALNLPKEENVSSGNIQDLRKEEEIVDSGEEAAEGGCRCFKFGGKEGGRRQRRRSSRSREGHWPFQICGSGWLPIICGGRKKASVSIPNTHEEEGLVNNGASDVQNDVEEVAGATGVVAAATEGSKSTQGCGCWHSKPRRRRAVAVDKEEGSGRRSKSKRRRGWLRRWGRKQRGGKERKR